MNQQTAVLDQLQLLSEETRVRLLAVLEAQELTVGELCRILELPQSTISRHLKQLVDQGWLALRREGTRSFYRLDLRELDAKSRKLWLLVRERLSGEPSSSFESDRHALQAVLEERRSRSSEFFAASAREWQRVRDELYGSGFDRVALAGLLDPEWVVGDLGCGTGELTALVAPFVSQVIGIDSSEEMLAVARQRTAEYDNVDLRHGRLENLPISDSSLDVVVLSLVLNHSAEPQRALREAARVLCPGGTALLLDLLPHSDEELQQRLGHVWLGFSEESLRTLSEPAALQLHTYRSLPRVEGSEGPALFAASLRVPRVPAPARAAERTVSLEPTAEAENAL